MQNTDIFFLQDICLIGDVCYEEDKVIYVMLEFTC